MLFNILVFVVVALGFLFVYSMCAIQKKNDRDYSDITDNSDNKWADEEKK